MRCRRDLRLSSAQPTGCSPPSSGTPCRSAAPARARPSSGFVGSWRTAGKLLAPANGFLRFRWSIDLTRGIHRKEPGSFRATSPPVTRARARVTGGRGHQLGEHVDRHARAAKHRIPAHDLAIQPILVGARVERVSSARAPEMCPFSKTIRENQTVRETFQGFASPNGSAARCPSPGTSTIALRALLAVAEEMLEGEIAYRRGEHDAAFDRLPSGPSLQRSATNRDAGAGEASNALSF